MFAITMTRRRTLLGVAVGVVLAAAGVGGLLHAQQSAVAPPPLDLVDTTTPAQTDLVFVSGAVAHPGLYRLSPDARISDAIAAAGGVLATADPTRLPNMAERVHDGLQVNVALPSAASLRAARLDVNSATELQLAAVPGMPEGLPAAIVERRSLWGPFASMSELRTDLEIDPATMSAISASLRVAPAA